MYLTAVIALAANACSAPEARPAAAAGSNLECQGGLVQNESDAARYAGCESVVGDLRITGSDLTDVNAFRQLRSVSGSLVVTDNAKLVSLSGLKGVRRARTVYIQKNPMLSGYLGLLPRLEQVEEPMVLRSNRGLSKGEVRDLLERVEVRNENATLMNGQARL
jgi:hypothetical protein